MPVADLNRQTTPGGTVGGTMLGAAATWLWEKYGKATADKAVGKAGQLWDRAHWKRKEAQYRTRLLQHYSTTKLLGNPKDIRIDKIYVDAYVLTRITAMRRLTVEDLMRQEMQAEQLAIGSETEDEADSQSQPHMPQRIAKGRTEVDESLATYAAHLRRISSGRRTIGERVALKEIALKEPRLYVLGKPGSGKSTFLKHITLLCCRGEIGKTPIFVSMKSWADSQLRLLDFIENEFEICQFPSCRTFVTKLLQSGNAFVLFDGLDEVNQEGAQRRKMIDTLSEFGRTYPNVHIIVTCRIAATDYSFDKFTYVEIADFTEEQQKIFAKNWYGAVPERLGIFELEWSRRDNAGLRFLAKTPMLLALMCLAFDETLSFPRRRVELYQEALGALLKKWDSSRGIVRDAQYRKLSLVRKEQLLSRIAATTFLKSEFFIPKKKLVSVIGSYLAALPAVDQEAAIDCDTVLRAMEVQHGILVERAHEIYSFSHLTFHEYFAARHFAENVGTEEMRGVILKYSCNDQWREVFQLIASLLDNGDRFLAELRRVSRKFVSGNPCIRALLEEVDRHAETKTVSDSCAAGLTKSGRRNRPATRRWDLDRLSDAALGIAMELNYSGESRTSRVMWRARQLAEMLQSNPIAIEKFCDNSDENLQELLMFLKSTQLFVECLNLAVSEGRANFLEEVLAP